MIKAWAATEAGGELKPFEYDPGPLRAHDVEIAVEHCGICHSDLRVFPLIMAQRSVSGSPVGSPATIARMLDFAARHSVKPVIETFRFDQVNEALARLRSGKTRYRIVLSR